MLRRLLQVALAFGAIFLASPSPAQTAPYPNRPVRLVVPFSAGGPVDLVARLIAQGLTARLSQPFVVENRPGAGGTVAADFVAHGPSDGYTLLVGSSSTLAVAPGLYRKLSYDPIKSFVPVSLISHEGLALLVNPSLPIQTVKELLNYLKARPGDINFGSPGSGTLTHLVTELFLQQSGLKAQHVPYKGGSESVVAAMTNQVQFIFNPVSTSIPLIQNGKLRPIGVTGTERDGGLPAVPTIAESGLPGFDADFWVGLVAPTGTPDAVTQKLWNEVRQLLLTQDVVAALRKLGSSPYVASRDAFGALVAGDFTKYTALARNAGITLD